MALKVVFFGYAWTSPRPDAYQMSIVEAFRRRGAEVHLLLSNYLSHENGAIGIHPSISERRLLEYIGTVDPTLVVSMNAGGLRSEIKAKIKAPVLTWLVDDLEHLFYPDGAGRFDGIVSAKDPLVSSSLETYGIFKRMFPEKSEHIHFLPSATDYESFRRSSQTKDLNISFVGSYLDYSNLEPVFSQAVRGGPGLLEGLLALIERLKTDHRGDLTATVEKYGLDGFLRDQGCDSRTLKMLLSNMISSGARIQAVERVHDLGFALFGNPEWIRPLLSLGEGAIRCFQGNQSIRSHEDLVTVYERSKLSINVAQLQIGPALPYRVFDIMASSALLIQPYHPQSDAFGIFGQDCPIPMYRDFNHLRELCEYFLAHEDERLERVRACNALVAHGFSFDDRVKDLLRIVGREGVERTAEPRIIQPGLHCFRRVSLRVIGSWKHWVLQALSRMIEKAFNPRQRRKLARLFWAGD